MQQLLVILSAFIAATTGPSDGLKPWPANKHPTDVPKSHVEVIDSGEHPYPITLGGTINGENCRSPMSCGQQGEAAFEQTWQSNRAVRLENIGQTGVVHPWLSNGRNQFRSVKEMVAGPGWAVTDSPLRLAFQVAGVDRQRPVGVAGDVDRALGDGDAGVPLADAGCFPGQLETIGRPLFQQARVERFAVAIGTEPAGPVPAGRQGR